MRKTIIGVLIMFSLSFLCLAQSPPYPNWSSVYSQSFILTDVYQGITSGKVWYDYNSLSQREDIANGSFHGYCRHLANQTTPCSILSLPGFIYFSLPEKQLCCYQKGKKNETFILPPNWPQLIDLKYQGQVTIDSQSYNSWQADKQVFPYFQYYTDRSPKQIQRRIQWDYPQIRDYIISTYSEDPIDQSIFAVPSYCKAKCTYPESRTEEILRIMRKLKKQAVNLVKEE